jgi:hypothetical protein
MQPNALLAWQNFIIQKVGVAVEDEVAVKNGVAKVGHALHLATLVAHREVTLEGVTERGIVVKCARHFTVVDELVLDRLPNLVHGNTMLLGDVLNLVVDHAKDPGEVDILHAVPCRVIDGRGIGEDVVGGFIALQGE